MQHTDTAPFSSFSHCYLVGIKGVAMTSLAELLVDVGIKVSGCDVAEDFVTAEALCTLDISITSGFDHTIPETVDCVIYTAAHQGKQNSIVQQAQTNNIQIYSQAEALGIFSAQKETIAVCGVGGKSTVSAMVTWVLEKLGDKPSYSVGVGSIVGLPKTGRWNQQSRYFVVEADEYVTNPEEVKVGKDGIPRFSFLHPSHCICTNIHFDHPDVYKTVEQTHAVYQAFFTKVPNSGTIICNRKDRDLVLPATKSKVVSFGSIGECDYLALYHVDTSKAGVTQAEVVYDKKRHSFKLQVPGRYNVENAVATITLCHQLGYEINDITKALSSFASTQRRFENKGIKDSITYYDDYAHHPSEISAVLNALTDWYPTVPCIIAFQPHTFSRTKELFTEFVLALSNAPQLILLDIFASARENFDDTVSSKALAAAIEEQNPERQVVVVPNYQELAKYLNTHAPKGSVILTIGAGDIYKVHELL